MEDYCFYQGLFGFWGCLVSSTSLDLAHIHYFACGQKTSTWDTYLDDSPLKPLLRTLSNVQNREIIIDKIQFHQECAKYLLPTVPIIGIFQQSLSNALDLPNIAHPIQLKAILGKYPDGLFFKPHIGTHGIGAFAVTFHDQRWHFPEGVKNTEELFEYCMRCAADGILLVQPKLKNSISLRPLMAENGFGTVRAVTYMDGGKPKLLAACLRLIVAGNAADNFSHGRSGNFVAPIDPLSGRLITLRASRSKTWPVIYDTDHHPVNSVPISGFEVPYWNECLQLIFRSQEVFCRLHSIGWDIGISDDGPLLIEGNAQYDFDLLQVAFDRGFRPELERVVATYQKQRLDLGNP